MNGSGRVARSRLEVEEWLRASLPDAWVACVDSGRSPGSASRYRDFDEEAWLAEMFDRRYLMASWPVEYGGLGWSRETALAAFEALSRYEAPLPLYVTSLLLAGHGLLQHGTAEQRHRFLPKIAAASEIWCQLFSEPEAGSDLASLRTRAERHAGGWVVTGQKVWSTWAHFARWGLLLARTGPRGVEAPGYHLLRGRHGLAGHRSAAAAPVDRRRVLQRGVHGPGARRRLDAPRRRRRGLDRGPLGAAGGAGRARPAAGGRRRHPPADRPPSGRRRSRGPAAPGRAVLPGAHPGLDGVARLRPRTGGPGGEAAAG